MHMKKVFYFGVFILVVFALVFHLNAMGHNHWKRAKARNVTSVTTYGFNYTSVGLFTRCVPAAPSSGEYCFPNLFPKNPNCYPTYCLQEIRNDTCQCDYLPSSKGIAACTIIASVFLGLALIILFIQSINTLENRSLGLILGLLPLILLLLTLMFILTALILVGSYLSRDIMELVRNPLNNDAVANLRNRARDAFEVRVDWGTGLEIIAIFFTFVSLLLYSAFLFKFSRSA